MAEQHGSDRDMGRFNKALVDSVALKPVQQAASALRDWHYEQTLPWSDKGPRILPAANYFVYTAGVRERRAKFDAAVAVFLAAYDSHVADAERRLGSLFRPAEYPPASKIARAFASKVDFEPMPDGADFRVALGDVEVARIRAEFEDRADAAIAEATRSLWQRCYDAVSHMVERLNAYQRDPDTGKVTAPFRDSLVENVRELVDLLPRLNLANDPALEAMRRRIAAELVGSEPQDLRDDDGLRNTVARQAADILAAMSGYCGEMAEAAE
ncbi:MAG TPA: hypothetical protein VNF04_11450 [Stellaceae bacterium]|nr:hypothetical protein [Stellaceae bacterium]